MTAPASAPPPGPVFLVGAGPGDPELITVRGLRYLRQADVVLYDRLVAAELLAEAPPRAERIDVGKAPGRPAPAQEAIQELMIDRARSGARVVRLKGGDPFVFGRGGEEIAALAAAGLCCEVVPGISSAVAVPGGAGIPLTYRGVAASFAVVTARRAPGDLGEPDWRALATLDTLVVLMGVSRLAEITALLRAAGRAATTPAALIERGTRPDQRVLCGTLGDLAERARAAGAAPPATLVVGEVVALRHPPRTATASAWLPPEIALAAALTLSPTPLS